MTKRNVYRPSKVNTIAQTRTWAKRKKSCCVDQQYNTKHLISSRNMMIYENCGKSKKCNKHLLIIFKPLVSFSLGTSKSKPISGVFVIQLTLFKHLMFFCVWEISTNSHSMSRRWILNSYWDYSLFVSVCLCVCVGTICKTHISIQLRTNIVLFREFKQPARESEPKQYVCFSRKCWFCNMFVVCYKRSILLMQ